MEFIGKKDPKHIMKRISAFVMSDGSLIKGKREKNVSCRLTTVHEEFAEYFKEVIEPITSVRIIQTQDISCKQGYFFQAYSPVHPYFTKLKPRFYKAGYRGIDPHALKLMDWEMFAIMYQCDGTIAVQKPKPTGMKLCTDRLTFGDCLYLSSCINKNLGITSKVVPQGKGKWRISFYAKDFYKIFSNIKPYTCDCFNYKILDDSMLDFYKDKYVI